MDDILKGLNVAQRAAVSSTASVLQVLAPPGSGKTKTLTARVAYLIANRQLKPWNIIVCTFTVKAANDMKERIRAFIGDELAKDLKLGTFHSVALRYLKRYGQHIGLSQDFSIADSSDSKAIVKRILKAVKQDTEPGQIISRISLRKVKGPPSDQLNKIANNVAQHEFELIYDEYNATLRASNLLDYDDLLLRCCELLEKLPQCVSNVEAVLIDEFQDTNTIQYKLMGHFAHHKNSITIVGDPDQSIYGFRLAEIQNLTRMKVQWPDTLTINLKENYRSSGAILHAAQKLIEQDESRPPKKLQATHSFGYRPVLRKLSSAYSEAQWLVSEVKRTQALTAKMLQLNDFAILLRSAALSRVIESSLNTAGVPYRMVGGIKFHDRVEVKLVVDYLRVIYQPENSEAMERIINVPSRKVGEETIKKLREEAHVRKQSLWKLIKDTVQGKTSPKTKLTEPTRKGLTMFVNVICCGREKIEKQTDEMVSVVDLIKLIASKISLENYLRTKFAQDESWEARWANVEELMAQAQEVADPEKIKALIEADALPIVDGAEQRTTSAQEALSLFLANIALTASADEKTEEDGEKVQQVTISTIHSAKGLEWPVVFIPACYEGSIPHSRAEDNDEERRLLYVGMTRAQALLYLSYPIKNTQKEETSVSTFLVQPGIQPYFEEHGPSLPVEAVAGLATTLQREAPKVDDITECRLKLERDEDNYWPLNGEEPLEEKAKWNYGRVSAAWPSFQPAGDVNWTNSTMQQQQNFSVATTSTKPGFVAATTRYNELLEQGRLTKVDKRTAKQEQKDDAPKGRKRQLDGQATISGFFNKRSASLSETSKSSRELQARIDEPLRDVSNAAQQRASGAHMFTSGMTTTSAHKVCNKPMQRKPMLQKSYSTDENTGRYVFLSSPPPPGIEQKASSHVTSALSNDKSEDSHSSSTMRPATTFHTTSMDRVAPQRKTLGVRRSLQGWNARTKR